MQTIAEILAQELGASPVHVQNVIDLLDGGNTIPCGSWRTGSPICGIWTSGDRR